MSKVPPVPVGEGSELTTAPADDSSSTGPSGWRDRVAGFDRRFPRGRLMLLLAVLVITLNASNALRVDQVSQVDEQYWIDHLLHGADFSIDRGGTVILQETVREKCERGMEDAPIPKCEDGHMRPSKYGYWHGINIAGGEPFYFFVTGPLARLLRATPIDLPPNDSLITWARLLASAWALIGMYLIIRIGDLLNVRRVMTAVGCVFVAATPALLHANSIVTPDATALPTGAAILFTGLWWERHRGRSVWWLVLASIVGLAFNEKNGIAVILVLAYFALRALSGRYRQADADDEDVLPWQEYAKVGGLLLVAVLVFNEAWDHIYGWIQSDLFAPPPLGDLTGNPISVSYGNKSIGFWDLFGPTTIFRMLPPFMDVHPPYQREHLLYQVMWKSAEYVAIGAMFAVAFRDKLVNKLSVLGFATLATLIVSPTLVVLRNQIEGGTFDQPVWRFGLSALPAIAIILAAAGRTRFGRWSITLLAAALYFSAIWVVFRSPAPS